jgi:hypothetical protein
MRWSPFSKAFFHRIYEQLDVPDEQLTAVAVAYKNVHNLKGRPEKSATMRWSSRMQDDIDCSLLREKGRVERMFHRIYEQLDVPDEQLTAVAVAYKNVHNQDAIILCDDAVE